MSKTWFSKLSPRSKVSSSWAPDFNNETVFVDHASLRCNPDAHYLPCQLPGRGVLIFPSKHPWANPWMLEHAGSFEALCIHCARVALEDL